MKAVIAKHLQVQQSQIKSVEEWANCLFVVVARLGARFVSKKIIKKAKETMDAEYQKPYEQLAEALSDLSRIASEEIFLKVENLQKNAFLPPQNIYKVFGYEKAISEYEVESQMVKNRRKRQQIGVHDALADSKGIRQGFVL